MKANAQKILLGIYRQKSQLCEFPKAMAGLVCPTLSVSGLRSVLYSLERQGYLDVSGSRAEQSMQITSLGQQLVTSLFPALLPKAEAELTWNLVVCLQPPKQDPGFRYLRRVLIESYGAIPLQRGTYLLARPAPPELLKECAVLYPQSVVIGLVNQWIFGNEMKLLKEYRNLQAVAQTYSGISKEIESLLIRNPAEIKLIQSEKQLILSLFNRLSEDLALDRGLVEWCEPKAPQPLDVLTRWQTLALNLW